MYNIAKRMCSAWIWECGYDYISAAKDKDDGLVLLEN